jgi:hypothetical protein
MTAGDWSRIDWARTSLDDRRDADLAGWPRVNPALERAYRRLLRAYPAGYRRRHGSEILTTLLEMSTPGQARPSRAETWHLIGAGLRQRFRLPVGRPPVWVAAVLVALIGGAFGAAAGSWTAERTFAAVPDPATVRALHESAVGGPGGELSGVDDNGSPWWGRMVATTTLTRGASGWDADAARQRLTADGWTLGATTHPEGSSSTMDEQGNMIELPVESASFRAERDGVVLDVDSWHTALPGAVTTGTDTSGADTSGADTSGTVTTTLWSADNGTLLPFTVIGILAGLTAGWLTAAAVAQRLRRAPAGRRRLITGLTLLTVAVLALPAVAFYGNVMRAFQYAGRDDPVFTVHSALTPGGYWPFGPGWLTAALTVAGLLAGVALLTVSAMTRPPAATGEQPVTS